MQELAQGQGIEVVFMPAGPLIEYNPAKVKQAPTTRAGAARLVQGQSEPADLRATGEFRPGHTPSSWACPTSSATRIPKDPVNGWDKTWAYLKELNCVHRVLPDRHRPRR